jgi:muconate cycloisomerase
MNICRIEIWPTRIPYISTYTSSRGCLSHGQGVILRLMTDCGLIGLGEASLIFPDRSGETQEGIVHVLAELFGPKLLGKQALSIAPLLQSLDDCAGDQFAFPYSRAAVDIALHDLLGKALQVPVYQLLGGLARRQVKVGRSLSIQSLADLVRNAEELRGAGYHGLTLKGSQDCVGDIERFVAVRQAMGDEFPLEIDPNQAYSVSQGLRAVRSLEPFGLANLEQPCAWWDLEGLKRISDASSVPVTADEAVMSTVDVMRVARMQAASCVTLKLARVGGIRAAHEMLTVARAAGLSCNLGSKHTFGVGTAAIAHFCAAHPEVLEPIGFGSPLEYFVDDILLEPIPFERGILTVSEGHGLGVTIDEKKLERYAERSYTCLS